MTVERRLVTVSALVLVEAGGGPESTAASFEPVAKKLAELARRRRNGYTRALVPFELPLTSFEARSEPLPEGSAEPTAGQLRAMLDEATRELADTGLKSKKWVVRTLRERAGLEAL